MDVEHVEALDDAFNHIGNVVKILCQLDNVFWFHRSDEVDGNSRQDFVVNLVAFVLYLVCSLQNVLQIFCGGESLDGLYEQVGLSGCNVYLLVERVEIVELALLSHEASRVVG